MPVHLRRLPPPPLLLSISLLLCVGAGAAVAGVGDFSSGLERRGRTSCFIPETTNRMNPRCSSSALLALAVPRGGVRRGGGGAAGTTAAAASTAGGRSLGPRSNYDDDGVEREEDEDDEKARLDAMVENLIGGVSSSEDTDDEVEEVEEVEPEGEVTIEGRRGGMDAADEDGDGVAGEVSGMVVEAEEEEECDEDEEEAPPGDGDGTAVAAVAVSGDETELPSGEDLLAEGGEASGAPSPAVADVSTKRRGSTGKKKHKKKKKESVAEVATGATAASAGRKKVKAKAKRKEEDATPRHDAQADDDEKESVDGSKPAEAAPPTSVAEGPVEAPEAPLRRQRPPPPIPPPPPNALYRFLLRRLHGFGGHVLVLTLVLLTELLRTYVPPLYNLLLALLIRFRIVEDPEVRRLRFEAEYREGERRRSRRVPSAAEEAHEQYGAFVSGGRADAKTRRARTRTMDKVAAHKLRTLSRRMTAGIGEVKYRHLSLDFMQRHGLGAFAGTSGAATVAAEEEDGPSPVAADVTADMIDNERLISESLTAAAKFTDEEAVEEEVEEGLDDSDDGDWVVRALASTATAGDEGDEAGTVDDGQEGYLDVVSESVTLMEREEVIELRPPPPPSPSFSLGFNFNVGSSTSRRRRSRGRRSSSKSAVLTAAEEAAGRTSRGMTGKRSTTSGRPRVSDRDGGGGVMGRLRAAGSSSAISNRILGAYPGDAPPVDEAGSRFGLSRLAAERYGYGEWSSYDDDEGENAVDGDDSDGVEEEDKLGGGSRQPRRVKRGARKKKKKRRRRRGEEQMEPLDEGPSHYLSSGFESPSKDNGLGADMAMSDLSRPPPPTPKSPFGSTASSRTQTRRRKGATSVSGESESKRESSSFGNAMDVESKLERKLSTPRSPFGLTSSRSSIDRTGTTESSPVKLPMQRLQEAAAKRHAKKRDEDGH